MGESKLVVCPKCGTSFDVDQSLRDEYNQKYKILEEGLRQKLNQETKSKEEAWRREQEAEKLKIKDLELTILRNASQQKQREQEIEIEKERYAQDKIKQTEFTLRQTIILQAQERSKQEIEKLKAEHANQMQAKDIERLQTQKLLEEANRKISQGSMQLQGEAQELVLENWLKQRFPQDEIKEVGKGVRGADCIQIVRNEFGRECGKIIYESKDTQQFNNDWVEKLKADLQRTNASIGVIVSRTLPSKWQQGGEISGIWICQMHELNMLIPPIRQMIIKIHTMTNAQHDRDNKQKILYNYITGDAFKNSLKNIIDTFNFMRSQITEERRTMERLWSAREKALEKVELSADKIIGDVGGIAGQNTQELLEDFTNQS